MLDRNELIQRLMTRIQTFMEPTEEKEKEKEKLSSIQSLDGKELYVNGDEITIGLEIYEVVDGQKQEIADSTYELIDGTKILVEGGIIKDIMLPKPAEVEVEIEPSTVEMCGPDRTEMMEDPRVTELENKVAELEKNVSDLLNIMETSMTKQEKMSETINKIAAQPAEEPFIPKQTEFNSNLTDKEERIKRIIELSKQK
jgi:hypothetical protein